MNQDKMFQSGNMEFDDDWETEKHLLEVKIKELENALEKSKKFHRKFVDDVVESEEIRNQEFDRAKREFTENNKKQLAEIRELKKDKNFYEALSNNLIKEKEASSKAASLKQSSIVFEPIQPSKSSTAGNLRSASQQKTTRKTSDGSYKISTKLFEDNKKLKIKVSTLTRANATLRLQVKRLEDFKTKIKAGTVQQSDDQKYMGNLLASTTRTNSQIFNQIALSKLQKLYQA